MRKILPATLAIYRRVAQMPGEELLPSLNRPQKRGVKTIIMAEIEIRLKGTKGMKG